MVTVYSFFMFLGTIGALCFAFSGLPQAYRSWKDGHSDGIAHGTIWLWLIGESMMLAYALHFYTNDFILTVNYTFNFLLVSVIFKYKYWRRKVIKTHKEKKEVVEEFVDDVICNKCGKSLIDEGNMNYEGLIEASVSGGFHSKIGDMVDLKFSLCEDCLIEMFKTFKHDPYVRDRSLYGRDSEEEFDNQEDESTDSNV